MFGTVHTKATDTPAHTHSLHPVNAADATTKHKQAHKDTHTHPPQSGEAKDRDEDGKGGGEGGGRGEYRNTPKNRKLKDSKSESSLR